MNFVITAFIIDYCRKPDWHDMMIRYIDTVICINNT